MANIGTCQKKRRIVSSWKSLTSCHTLQPWANQLAFLHGPYYCNDGKMAKVLMFPLLSKWNGLAVPRSFHPLLKTPSEPIRWDYSIMAPFSTRLPLFNPKWFPPFLQLQPPPGCLLLHVPFTVILNWPRTRRQTIFYLFVLFSVRLQANPFWAAKNTSAWSPKSHKWFVNISASMCFRQSVLRLFSMGETYGLGPF